MTQETITGRPEGAPLNFNKEHGLLLFDRATRDNPHISSDVIADSKQRVVRAFTEWESGPEALIGQANSAFLIHTRRYPGSHPHLDDAGRCFPALSQKYGISDKGVEELWNSLPPFRVGEIAGTMPNRAQVKCALISVPLSPMGLASANSASERSAYAVPRITAAVDFANKLGAQAGYIGLGETLASLTNHGLKLQEKYPNNNFATGHAFTTLLIREWVREAAHLKDERLSEVNITILGANGSIGSATLGLLAEEGVGHVTLFDVPGTEGRLTKKIQEFGLAGKARILTGIENLEEACSDSSIIVSGVSSLRPIVNVTLLKPGTMYVDDSQPPSVWRGGDTSILWVVGKLPSGMKRTFDYGIDGEWGCAAETVIMTARKLRGEPLSLETVGKVDTERVRIAGELAKKFGFTLADPQSFGERTTIHIDSPVAIAPQSAPLPPIDLFPRAAA